MNNRGNHHGSRFLSPKISSVETKPMTSNFNYASKHGDLIPRQGLAYCDDDNTFQPYTFHVNAWACLLSDAPKASPVPSNPTAFHTWEDLMEAMFS